ncbi:MAG: hypothetical protein GC178_07460 [Flavobacteriales bacterium]|nr:hypothetical protein [Flavobacteriales bacterium]
MGTLIQDIKQQSKWAVRAFEADGYELDYSIESLLEIDRFIQRHTKDGQPVKGGRLSKNYGGIIFSLSAYVGETLIKNVPKSKWVTDDKDPMGEINIAVKLGDGTTCWPAQRMIKRIQNGLEDGIYPYGHKLAENSIKQPFDQDFWKIDEEVKPIEPKSWWQFWK